VDCEFVGLVDALAVNDSGEVGPVGVSVAAVEVVGTDFEIDPEWVPAPEVWEVHAVRISKPAAVTRNGVAARKGDRRDFAVLLPAGLTSRSLSAPSLMKNLSHCK